MWLGKHGLLLELPLKLATSRAALCVPCARRHYASTSNPPEQHIAVVGGGISGLASAYFISSEMPNAKITIYEQEDKLGGWIQSRHVQVPGGEVLFEHGPRTLRPGWKATPTALLIQELGLVEDLLTTSKNSPAARRRYILYPDRINCLPNMKDLPSLFGAWRCVSSGLFNGGLSLITEHLQPFRPRKLNDESVGDFISRRLDKRLASNIVSAAIHGIYAGDIWQLSAKTLFPLAWHLEGMGKSIMSGMLEMASTSSGRQHPMWTLNRFESYKAESTEIFINLDDKVEQALENASTFTFKNGLQQLIDALKQKLAANPQVQFRLNSSVNNYRKAEDKSGRIQVEASPADATSDNVETKDIFDQIVWTPPQALLTPSVTVQVVNFYFSKPNLHPYRGFGFLIPESVPFEQNPERALGVIFDSDAVQGQDNVDGTKVTVMLGGRWWDDWEGLPDAEEGLELARSVIRRHLGIIEEPTATNVTTNYSCIPQYTVGYENRLRKFGYGLMNEFKGKVKVVGSQYNGVGVTDCILAAYFVANDVRRGDPGCGLDRILVGRAQKVKA
ncbi:Protoporphyrinogen oxidase [Polyplosphaeria fusca]|uniref:Protoporphyrinogen oxidase n=1 Tax=Polyplosphaeria fusca TaxID=682080 RepID=A0A9P4R1F3_9PLEO|nr:Protoporphyrinogen oxidase [Polyplosphaeria fusca]